MRCPICGAKTRVRSTATGHSRTAPIVIRKRICTENAAHVFFTTEKPDTEPDNRKERE